MGKTKIRKVKNRPNPVGVQGLDCKGRTSENADPQSNSEKTITSLLDQLQVPDSEQCLCALRRLAEFFFDDDQSVIYDPSSSISLELHNRLVKTVAPFLVDNRPDVRNAACGALRNINVAGGHDMCDIMISNDVMTPLISLVEKYSSDSIMIVCETEMPDDKKLSVEKENLNTLYEAINLLRNLCESNEVAVKHLNASNVVTVLLKFMDVSIGGVRLAVAVARCLHSVSENNKTILKNLQTIEEDIIKLIMVENDEPLFLHLKMLAGGLLINLHGCVPLNCSNVIFNLLLKVIEFDTRSEMCSLSSEIPLDKESVLSSDSLKKLEVLCNSIEAQITALEMLTNMCSCDDEDCMETESLNDSDVDDDYEDLDCEDFNNSSLHPLTISSHVHEALAKLKFLQHAYNKTNLPSNVSDILNNHTDTRGILRQFQLLRCRAFHFLNNLISVMEPDDLGKPDELFKIWTEIGHMITSSHGNLDVFEASTACLRAVLKQLVSIKHPGLLQLSSSDLLVIFKIVEHCSNDGICANIVQIVAALGVYCSSQNLEILLKDIGLFILSIAERPGPLWLIAEALDALMDVFAEDNTDRVTQEIALVARLSVLAPAFKKKVKAEHKTLGDQHALIMTANSNLTRFITYKKNRFRNVTNVSTR